MSSSTRLTLSIPDDVVAMLDAVSSRLGVSRSAIGSELLRDELLRLKPLLPYYPISAVPADPVRLRGESVLVVRERLSRLRGASDV